MVAAVAVVAVVVVVVARAAVGTTRAATDSFASRFSRARPTC